jgi:hypothetical protein
MIRTERDWKPKKVCLPSLLSTKNNLGRDCGDQPSTASVGRSRTRESRPRQSSSDVPPFSPPQSQSKNQNTVVAPYIRPGGILAVTPVTMLTSNHLRGIPAVTLPLHHRYSPRSSRYKCLRTFGRFGYLNEVAAQSPTVAPSSGLPWVISEKKFQLRRSCGRIFRLCLSCTILPPTDGSQTEIAISRCDLPRDEPGWLARGAPAVPAGPKGTTQGKYFVLPPLRNTNLWRPCDMGEPLGERL